eukprot:PhF_6_TR15413/c0_g1_i1/m.23893/K20304/TRAPPC6, TRS33; trafficking protein particle complex subunit 6
MNAPGQKQIFVAESALILLQMEIVRYAVNTHYVPNEEGAPRQSQEGVYRVLEGMGFRVGTAFMERVLLDKLITTQTPPKEPIDAMKMLCKDLWGGCFRSHPAPQLRTDKKSLFHIKEPAFRWLRNVHFAPNALSVCDALVIPLDDGMSGVPPAVSPRAVLKQQPATPTTPEDIAGIGASKRIPSPGPIDYLASMGGIIRGALASLGFVAVVEPKFDGANAVTFVVTFTE